MKTLKEVEALTGIKATTLRKRIFRKKLDAIKIGRDWLLNEKEVEALLERKK